MKEGAALAFAHGLNIHFKLIEPRPDLDVFIASAEDPLLFLEYHRQFTHALVFIPVGAFVAALVLHWTVRRTLRPIESYLACLVGYATHGFLDACTSYGTQLLWPFTDERFAWNNVSVVDPLFTAPLVAFVVAAAVTRRRVLAILGLAWAAGYLLFGVVQTQRVEAAAVDLAADRGHQPNRVTVKAGFANLLVWKIIYEHGGRYHVDAVRAGMDVIVCPGASVAALDIARDLPWLDLNSQQARDVERFRWFSIQSVRTKSSTFAIPSCRIRSIRCGELRSVPMRLLTGTWPSSRTRRSTRASGATTCSC